MYHFRFLGKPLCWAEVGGMEGHNIVWCPMRWKGVSTICVFANFVSFIIAIDDCMGTNFLDGYVV